MGINFEDRRLDVRKIGLKHSAEFALRVEDRIARRLAFPAWRIYHMGKYGCELARASAADQQHTCLFCVEELAPVIEAERNTAPITKSAQDFKIISETRRAVWMIIRVHD